MKTSIYILIGWLIFYPTVASAYIGPGLGAGALASVVGILAGFFMLIIGVVWYPIKRVIKYFKGKK
ncbi:MAG: hypothetical protein D4R63_05260 [Methylococcaceae bacterium]|jgi:hypothetical protein|nr:MAG: hypothetical protein D4R63_05260 [Methylococcaceae bacterium]